MEFYTYIYYDPSRNNEPIYVGKGSKERAWRHLRHRGKSPFISRLIHMKNLNVNPVIGIYIALDEEFAHLLEVELIAQFGRKDLGDGPLLNLTDGGDGIAGAVLGPRPDDVKRKISLGNTGKHLLDSTKKKLSDLKKGKPGHPRSAETREKIRIAHLGKPKITNSLKGRTWDEIYGKEAADIRRLKNTRKNKR